MLFWLAVIVGSLVVVVVGYFLALVWMIAHEEPPRHYPLIPRDPDG